MRILISPLPKPWGGPGVFLRRVADELNRRGYKWTSYPFHYTGVSIIPWDHGFIMGAPRFTHMILESGKPVISTVGKPEIRKELQAVGRTYCQAMDTQERLMETIIIKSTKVVFISKYVLNIWRDIFHDRKIPFPDEHKIAVIHHGLDIDQFKPLKGYSANTEAPFVIGMVGAIRDRFRIDTLFEVSKRLPFDHKLMVIGRMTHECLDRYKMYMSDPDNKKKAQYVEWVEAAKLPQYYQKMHCLFHPVDYEGFSIVCAEALSCGVPVVVPGHGAPKEFIMPDGGLAVETRQYNYGNEYCDKMAQAISTIHADWERFSLGARKMAEANLSIRKTVDKYLGMMGVN